MPVEDYLQKHFEDREPEYRDGILEEREMPDAIHGLFQSLLAVLLGPQMLAGQLAVVTETRMRLGERRYVLPDVAIFEGRITEIIPSLPPLAVIEILSPSESMPQILRKFGEYHQWGVENIWLIDPAQRSISQFDGQRLLPLEGLSVPKYTVSILATDLFNAADRLAPPR